MHILANHIRNEFMAVPELVRICMSRGVSGMEPTLLIKSNTLRLKYLIQQQRIRLGFCRVGDDWLAYYVEINDGDDDPVSLWSVAQDVDELDALRSMSKSSRCVVHLFNELALNQASTETDIQIDADTIDLFDATVLYPNRKEPPSDVVDKLFENNSSPGLTVEFEIENWNPVSSTYITNAAGSSFLSLFDENEGNQQEQLGVWLADTLVPKGVIRNPYVEEPKAARELTDLLLTYEYGSFLFESKTLAITARGRLPKRSKLSTNLHSGVRKALSQLSGGVRNLKRGYRVVDGAGVEIEVERDQPVHAIIIVPDLSLLSSFPDYQKTIAGFMEKTGGFVHILDVRELMRVVQAATEISSMGKKTTMLMAFDFYLIERAKYSLEQESPDFSVLLRVVDEESS